MNAGKSLRHGQQGVTLLELMIVLVIIAIMASFAYPSYQQYIVNTKRTAATSTLLRVADRQQQFFMDNKRYAADLTTLEHETRSTEATTAGKSRQPLCREIGQ